MALITLILFSSFWTWGYETLSEADRSHLLTKAKAICEDIKGFATKENDKQLSEAHERHCVKPARPQLSALIGAFYHMGMELPKKDRSRKAFYLIKLQEIALLTKLYPDYKSPKDKWDLKGAIFELSGLALDRRANKVWTQGDSGTGAFIANVDVTTGKTQRVKVNRAVNVDWEAIVMDQDKNILVLDVGDNNRKRSKVSIYKIKPETIVNNQVQAEKFDFKYDEGAMDCEGAVIKGQTLFLFEKVYYQQPRVYAVDLSQSPLKARLLGRLPSMGLITDASLTEDGRLFVLTYTGIDEIENFTNPKEAKVRNVITDQWGQVEGFTALSEKSFWVGREDGKVFEINL